MKLETAAYEERMKKSLAATETEFSSIRAGKASAALLDRIQVEYYGTPTPINQLAQVNTPEARVLVIQPWDIKALKDIEKAILASDLGINPQNDGKCIRLTFPQLTEERRKELSKQVSKLGEDGKVAMRNIRRDANDKIKEMKKSGEMTEDEQKTCEKSIQDLTDKYIKLVDAAVAAKSAEIMSL